MHQHFAKGKFNSDTQQNILHLVLENLMFVNNDQNLVEQYLTIFCQVLVYSTFSIT